MKYINISGYKFISLSNLDKIQKELKSWCFSHSLKGTILLSEEGINVFLCGTRVEIDAFIENLPSFGLPSISFKESISDFYPFKHMLVKIKKEIIPMGIPEISPAKDPAPSLSVHEFKKWLDEGVSFIILDTRNQCEIELGKFTNAVDLKITHFREFPQAISQLPDTYKDKIIVTYCTGGIRCEKAAPLMINKGFQNVYQLDGGILKYIEHYGNAHFDGECFVFDNRIALDHQLKPTEG